MNKIKLSVYVMHCYKARTTQSISTISVFNYIIKHKFPRRGLLNEVMWHTKTIMADKKVLTFYSLITIAILIQLLQ